tara:strand:+ start:45 stop:518 length:474 start_codon:yes stop_codon:yes gene_type:complete
MVKNIFLAIIIITLSSQLVLSDTDLGYKHYEKGEFDKAFSVWKEEIKKGNKEAMFNMGLLYFFGKGVDKDLKIAFDYCKSAALRGSSRAQNNLAYMFSEGLGVKKSYIDAYAWSFIAIKSGYSSHDIKDNARINLTPAMLNDANKLITKISKEMIYE